LGTDKRNQGRRVNRWMKGLPILANQHRWAQTPGTLDRHSWAPKNHEGERELGHWGESISESRVRIWETGKRKNKSTIDSRPVHNRVGSKAKKKK